jgi:hypothetical protein
LKVMRLKQAQIAAIVETVSTVSDDIVSHYTMLVSMAALKPRRGTVYFFAISKLSERAEIMIRQQRERVSTPLSPSPSYLITTIPISVYTHIVICLLRTLHTTSCSKQPTQHQLLLLLLLAIFRVGSCCISSFAAF